MTAMWLVQTSSCSRCDTFIPLALFSAGRQKEPPAAHLEFDYGVAPEPGFQDHQIQRWKQMPRMVASIDQ
jgi:hypothetical protein